MKKAAIYVRVSTEEQRKHGLSVDSQITALNEFCKDNSYQVVKIYNDAGISARKRYTKRPALLELLEDVKQKKIDIILFTKLDRWFRSVADYYEVQSILDANGVAWRSIWEDYETITSSGVFKVNIMLSVAQSEADRTSERIKTTFEYKLQKGEYVGAHKAPIGYSRNGKKYIINKDEEEGVKAFFKTYLSTFSMAKSIEAAREHNVVLNSNTAHRILYHKAHYGALPYVEGAYITKEEHELIEKAKKKTKNYSTGYQYIFSGLVVCAECGGHMVANRTIRQNKNGTSKTNIRYVCKKHEGGYDCKGTSINEADLESYMVENIFDKIKDYNVDVETRAKSDNKKQIEQLHKRLQRLKDLYELGDIELDEYKTKRDAITEEITSLDVQNIKPIQLPPTWEEIYEQLDVQHKRAFWYKITKEIRITEMKCKTPIIIF